MNSVDKLTLDKTLKIYNLVIFIRCIFNNKNMHFNYDNTVSKRRVLFLESDLYIFAVTTHVVFYFHMVLLFQASLVTMKKSGYLDCSVNLFIKNSL